MTVLTVDSSAKSYGATHALRGISFTARPGEVLAVLGENGAGKTTLLKILAGSVRPDEGTIRLNGEALDFRTPRDALRSRVILIPQELAYVPALTVAENIMMGSRSAPGPIVTQRALRSAARPFAEQLGVEGILDQRMNEVTLAEAQLVEIAKGLARDARVLLLDEPTAALSQAETDRLFRTIDSLRLRDIVMVFISHRLDEVLEHGDAVLVLRDGQEVLSKRVADVSKSELVSAMLGSTAGDDRTNEMPTGAFASEPMLVAAGVSLDDDIATPGISIEVRSGEVVTLYGVRGAGHEAFIESVAGVRAFRHGTLSIDGRRAGPFHSVRAAKKFGVAFVPADRKKHGLMLHASITANLGLPQLAALSRFGWMSRVRERRLLGSVASTMNLKYRDGSQNVQELSGGNQQKVLVGSRLVLSPKLLVVHEPTRGVDVGARKEIHRLIGELAKRGTAVLVATTDIEEAVDLADRLAVVRDGEIVTELTGDRKTQDRALEYAVGGMDALRIPEGDTND